MQSADVWRLLKQLRPYLGAGRVLLTATLVSSLVMVLFEGVGVGLLVPLMSLLLGGTNADADAADPVAADRVSRSLAGVLRRRLLRRDRRARSRPRTSPPTSRSCSRRGSSGGSRPACGRRSSRRLQRADLDLFDQRPAGEIANIFLVETYRTTVAIEAAVGFVQRASIALFYVGGALLYFLAATSLVVVLGARARRRARRSSTAGWAAPAPG